MPDLAFGTMHRASFGGYAEPAGLVCASDPNGDSSRHHAGREGANRPGATNRLQTLFVDLPGILEWIERSAVP